MIVYICIPFAGVVELVDTLDLGSSAARCESSSLSARTFKIESFSYKRSFFVLGNFIILERREVYPERSRRESLRPHKKSLSIS